MQRVGPFLRERPSAATTIRDWGWCWLWLGRDGSLFAIEWE